MAHWPQSAARQAPYPWPPGRPQRMARYELHQNRLAPVNYLHSAHFAAPWPWEWAVAVPAKEQSERGAP